MPGGDVRLDLVAVRGADQRAGLGLLVERAAEPDPLGAARRARRRSASWIDSSTTQPGAGRADLAGVQEDRGEREVERDLEVGVGEDDVGVLAAELEGDLLHGAGGRGHQPPAGREAAGERDQVDARVRRRAARPASGPAPSTRLPTPAGSPASSSSRIRWIAVCGVSSLGLSTKVLPAARHGRDLPGGLQQRVVPRRDQRRRRRPARARSG